MSSRNLMGAVNSFGNVNPMNMLGLNNNFTGLQSTPPMTGFNPNLVLGMQNLSLNKNFGN